MGKTLFFFGFYNKGILQLFELFRILLGEVVGLREVFFEVVEFPDIVIGIPGRQLGF